MSNRRRRRRVYYHLAFNLCWEVVGPVRFRQLLERYKSAERAWKAPKKDFFGLGWGERAVEKFCKLRDGLDIETEMERVGNLDVELLIWDDENYPENLRQIDDPPFLLYVRGNLKRRDRLALAVVGSRKMTNYGKDVAGSLVPELAAGGLTIVSGLAFGIDYAAHQAALEAGGRVVAVLASGVDKVTPRAHEGLARAILRSGRGAIVSEFPLGTEPKNYYFPFRNRIISGLSLATLVIEAAEKSGTLHTVRAALDQGRDVFAVPGSIFNPLSRGPLKLVKEGAKVVCAARDILEELDLPSGIQAERAREILPEDPQEERVLAVIGKEEAHLDLIVRRLGLPAAEVLPVLTGMELKGMVKHIGGSVYRKS